MKPREPRIEIDVEEAVRAGPVRINVGCGASPINGYINVDVQEEVRGVAPDVVAEARSIPLPDGCAEELLAVHLFEHFYRWEVDAVIAEWKRLLRPRGRLILELPDLMKCCRNVLQNIQGGGTKHPDQLGMWGLYGDPRDEDPWMTHKWGWTENELKALLEANGFFEIARQPTQFHVVGRQLRDMRIEARKGE